MARPIPPWSDGRGPNLSLAAERATALSPSDFIAACLDVDSPDSADFPARQVSAIFSSSDEDDRHLPVYEVFSLVRHVRSESRSSRNPRLLLSRIDEFLEAVLRERADCLTPWELSRVLHLRGELHHELAYEQGRLSRSEEADRATRLFLEATSHLPCDGPQSKDRRQAFWRAANLMVEMGRYAESLPHFENALVGLPQFARRGLYFQCATRLFRIAESLQDGSVDQVIHVARGDLVKAWARLSWMGSQPDPSDEEGTQEAVGVELIKWPHVVPTGTSCSPPAGLYVRPLDRVGVCSLLLRATEAPKRVAVYRAELEFLLRLPQFQDATATTAQVRPIVTYLADSDSPRPTATHSNTPRKHPATGIANHLKVGRLVEAAALGGRLLAEELDDEDRVLVAIRTGRALGFSLSAVEERKILEQAMRTVESGSGRPDLLAELRMAMGRTAFHNLRHEEALDVLEQALDDAGDAADMGRVVRCHGLRAQVVKELSGSDRRLLDDNAFIWGASLSYGRPEWVGYLVDEGARYRLPEGGLDEGDPTAANPVQLLRQAIYDSIDEGNPPSQRRDGLRAQLDSLSDQEDRVSLGQCVDLILHPQMSSRRGIKLKNTLDHLLDELGLLRGGRVRLRLAEKVASSKSGFSPALSHHAAQTTLNLLCFELEHLKDPRLRRRKARDLRRQLTTWVSQQTQPDPELLLTQLHHLKSFSFAEDALGDEQVTLAKKKSLENSLEPGVPRQEGENLGALDLPAVTRCLGDQDACLVEYFLTARGPSYAVLLTADRCELIEVPLGKEELRDCMRRVSLSIHKSFGMREPPQASHFEHALSGITNEITRACREGNCGTSIHNQILAAVQCELTWLADRLWPILLREAVSKYRLLYIAPDSQLYRLPLHALCPTETEPIIFHVPCMLIPKAGFLAKPARRQLFLGEDLVIADADDLKLDTHSFLESVASAGPNRWGDVRRDRLLTEIAGHKRFWFYGHAHHDRWDPLLSRLSLWGGGRLTAFDVEHSDVAFHGCDIHLYACGSGQATVRRESQRLGLACAFISRGADTVISSLWRVDAAIPPAFVAARTNGSGQSIGGALGYQAGWIRTRIAERCTDPFHHWLRISPVVAYGLDSATGKR